MDKEVLGKWITIDKIFVDGVLPDHTRKMGDPQKLKRKHLVQNDFNLYT